MANKAWVAAAGANPLDNLSIGAMGWTPVAIGRTQWLGGVGHSGRRMSTGAQNQPSRANTTEVEQ